MSEFKPSEFKPGDMVLLKSGGPRMTVLQSFLFSAPPYYMCGWFTSDNKFNEACFNVESLKEAK